MAAAGLKPAPLSFYARRLCRRSLPVFCLSVGLLAGFALAYAISARALYAALASPVTRASPAARTRGAGRAPELFVGVLSHPANVERRAVFRKHCAERYRKEGIEYRIFMGRPSEHVAVISSGQGQHASPLEIEQSRRILNESIMHKDVFLFPMREHYRDLTDKVIKMYQYGVRSGAHFIAKLDDDQCLDTERVLADVRRKRLRGRVPPEIYLGTHMWKGREYDIMVGPNNHSAPYMGSLSMLSHGLAQAIFIDDRDHTVMYSVNGTSSEDTNMGRWVQRAKELNPRMKVAFLTNPKYVRHVGISGTK